MLWNFSQFFPVTAITSRNSAKGYRLTFPILLLLFAFCSPPVFAEELHIPQPGINDKCPVCGMFVSRYPDWTATVVYKDGHAAHFDGAKDMFRYLFNLSKYAGKHIKTAIAIIAVTEYYGLKKIPAKKAFFVIGSDVYGPMGYELIPLANNEDAKEFLKDHNGSDIVSFDEITPQLIDRLVK